MAISLFAESFFNANLGLNFHVTHNLIELTIFKRHIHVKTKSERERGWGGYEKKKSSVRRKWTTRAYIFDHVLNYSPCGCKSLVI
jgi:hypothetical protein